MNCGQGIAHDDPSPSNWHQYVADPELDYQKSLVWGWRRYRVDVEGSENPNIQRHDAKGKGKSVLQDAHKWEDEKWAMRGIMWRAYGIQIEDRDSAYLENPAILFQIEMDGDDQHASSTAQRPMTDGELHNLLRYAHMDIKYFHPNVLNLVTAEQLWHPANIRNWYDTIIEVLDTLSIGDAFLKHPTAATSILTNEAREKLVDIIVDTIHPAVLLQISHHLPGGYHWRIEDVSSPDLIGDEDVECHLRDRVLVSVPNEHGFAQQSQRMETAILERGCTAPQSGLIVLKRDPGMIWELLTSPYFIRDMEAHFRNMEEEMALREVAMHGSGELFIN